MEAGYWAKDKLCESEIGWWAKGVKDLSQSRILPYRGSYMSAHVLLNLLNMSRKRDKMRGLPSILSLFRNKFNEFNNTRA